VPIQRHLLLLKLYEPINVKQQTPQAGMGEFCTSMLIFVRVQILFCDLTKNLTSKFAWMHRLLAIFQRIVYNNKYRKYTSLLGKQVMKIIHHSKVCEDQKIESYFGLEFEAIAHALGKRGVKIEPRELSDAQKQTISIQTRFALRIKKGKGERVGHIPFGQKLAQDGIHLESNYEEQEVINQIAGLRAHGLSVRKIARIMNLDKMFNRFGARWNHESIHLLTKKITKQEL